jgi:hypothetical protein
VCPVTDRGWIEHRVVSIPIDRPDPDCEARTRLDRSERSERAGRLGEPEPTDDNER